MEASIRNSINMGKTVSGRAVSWFFLCLILFSTGVKSANFDVLWYSYAIDTSPYKSQISSLASNAHTWLQGDGHSWNLSYFGPGDTPVFSDYDVLVIHSAEAFWTSGTTNNGDYVPPNFSGIFNNKGAIEAARGARTVLSGSDADFHAARGDTGLTPQFDPDYAEWNGAIGYTINSVNWAAEGDGMGVVSFYHGESPGGDRYWWTDENSFLKQELDGYVADFYKDFGSGKRENFPKLTPGAEGHALNDGLTADGDDSTLDGLENWQWSFHGGFAKDIPGYVGLQESTKHPDYYVTIATSLVPVPAAFPLFFTGLALLIGIGRGRLAVRYQGENSHSR